MGLEALFDVGMRALYFDDVNMESMDFDDVESMWVCNLVNSLFANCFVESWASCLLNQKK